MLKVHAYPTFSSSLLIVTLVVGCSGLERGYWISPDERGGHGSEVAEELAVADIRIEAELTEDLGWEGESLDAGEFEAGEKELETLDSAREVCESLPDSFIFCCSSDDECVGKLLRIGEDQCNPAVCNNGTCVLTEAEPGTPCEDGNKCTERDFCDRVSGKMTCISGTPLNCDDQNICTTDICMPEVGCIHTPNDSVCAQPRCEGLVFYRAVKCSNGQCPPQAGENCDDGNTCTTDSCDSESGCVHVPNDLVCAQARCEGLVFYPAVKCSGGSCPQQIPQDCDDHNQCTDDFCDPSEGCKHSPNPIYCVVYFLDMDQDGFGISGNSKCLCGPSGFYTALQGGDCDDNNPLVNPNATEVCNNKDDNCNGQTDETWSEKGQPCDGSDSDLCKEGIWVCKTDGSGIECTDTSGDTREVCSNGVDDDCDGTTDENEENLVNCTTFYYDQDNDGYGVTTNKKCYCSPFGNYRATRGGDCNDSDANINPGKTEVCRNNKDDDCDGTTDENEENLINCLMFYYDQDNDGYGVTTNKKCYCSPLGNYRATMGGDCDDGNDQIFPGATEKCNEKDDDCDGQTDEGLLCPPSPR